MTDSNHSSIFSTVLLPYGMKKMSPYFKGYFFAFLGTLAMSNVYIFSKAALLEVGLIQFGFCWYGMAIIWNLLYALPKKKYKTIRLLNKKSIKVLIIIGFIELIAAVSFFLAINRAENPATLSFLTNLTPLFVTLLGFVILQESFNKVGIIGIILTLLGAFIISFRGNHSFSDILLPGTGFIILSSFFVAIGIIAAKKNIKNLDPGILAINRVLFLFTFFFILLISTGTTLAVSHKALFNIALGSLLGPFLTALSQYSALQYIEASRTSLVQSTKGIFVLIGSFIYLGMFPMIHQIAGGILSIIGVVIIITGKSREI